MQQLLLGIGRLTYVPVCIVLLGLVAAGGQAQPVWQFNALADIEFSVAGSDSHYYYNEIHADHLDPQVAISQLNLLGQVDSLGPLVFRYRLLLEREAGQSLTQFRIPQLHLQWLSTDERWGVTVGRFVQPFGSFNEKQLSTQRTFIGLPLAYSYYVNVSDQIGFVYDMGDVAKVRVDSTVQWGSSLVYYGGYTTGLMGSWAIQPGKLNWQLALTNGAANVMRPATRPLQLGLQTRLLWQPTYFWQQGLSLSRGSFMQENAINAPLTDLAGYTQTLVGTDFRLGSGFFSVGGELIGGFYTVPRYLPDTETYTAAGTAQSLQTWSGYLDLRYEPPVLPGSYVAYRIDHLTFSQDTSADVPWDNTLWRHSLAMGYRINRFLLLRAAVSTQRTANKNWNTTQQTLRVMVTGHF